MPRRTVNLRGGGRPILDIASYGRSAGRPLTQYQRLQIALTVGRVPEVMVKVSGGARSMSGVEAHLAYIGREGELAVETDQGFRINGKGFQKYLVSDWDLDLHAHRRQDERSIRGIRPRPRLVHNIIFSMPPGTPEKKLLKAVRKFADNQFALKHRYALALHTDEAHPHVHLVVKAVSEQGERLSIRKETLRHWREMFAAHLREQGIAANATERAVRGQIKKSKLDGIYRSMQRKRSTRERQEITAIASKDSRTLQRSSAGEQKLQQTRSHVLAGWIRVEQELRADGLLKSAEQVRLFVGRMVPPKTDQQQLIDRSDAQRLTRLRDPLGRTL